MLDREVNLEILKQYSDSDKNALLKYFAGENLNLQEIELLEEIYLKNIIIQKENLNNKIDISKIKGLISCVSFSYNENKRQYEENLLDRNLKIFSNLKIFILLYTNETKKYFEKIKDKYKSIKIIGILITEYTFFSIQDKIKKILKEVKLNKSNCIIDITLGLKIITISLYKTAIENEILAVNWQEIQLQEFNGTKIKNFSFASKLKIMIEPQRENIKIYSKINELLRKYNFEGIEITYSQLNNEEMRFFYNNLKNVFSFNLMISLDYELFYEQLEVFFINLITRKNYSREFILKTRNFLSGLLSLLLFEEDGEKIKTTKYLESILKVFQISLNDLKENYFFLAKYKQEIYYYFALNYFYSNLGFNNISYYGNKFIKNIKEKMLKELGKKDKIEVNQILKSQNFIEDIIDIKINDKLMEMDPAISLRERLNGEFYLKNNTLYIEKYNLEINIKNDLRLKFLTNKGSDLLRELLENHKEKKEKADLFERLAKHKEDELEENRRNRFRRNLVNLKKKSEELNIVLKKIGQEIGLELDDIIIYEKKNTINKDSDYCHSFYINPKYYILI